VSEQAPEPGSFRDPNARVFYSGGEVLRGLSARALDEFDALASTTFFRRNLSDGRLVQTERLADGHTQGAGGPWAAVLKHRRIPYISYPYEWSFGMLKDAALLQLALLRDALDEGMILKDASAFNVQWEGARPTFIDITSFERLKSGSTWVGYRQFCQLFLYPLFLQAYKQVSFQPWLRGRLDGIEPQEFVRVMSVRDLVRPGVLTHGYLQARAQAHFGDSRRNIKSELSQAGFSVELIKVNVKRLEQLVGGLTWVPDGSPWADYTTQNSYTTGDSAAKAEFVRDAAKVRPRELVWDLGANTGTYARIAAEHAGYVVAFDADHLAVERLYQALRAERNTKILPLVCNVADPSPSQGWRTLERKPLAERGTPDLALCLALLHHLAIGANLPLDEIVDWLASLHSDLVVEFVTKDDPMVRTLLRNKSEQHPEYDRQTFERLLRARFTVERQQEIGNGRRVLYYATPANR
jgi:ribosomal protein L11 methylase PrmA